MLVFAVSKPCFSVFKSACLAFKSSCLFTSSFSLAAFSVVVFVVSDSNSLIFSGVTDSDAFLVDSTFETFSSADLTLSVFSATVSVKASVLSFAVSDCTFATSTSFSVVFPSLVFIINSLSGVVDVDSVVSFAFASGTFTNNTLPAKAVPIVIVCLSFFLIYFSPFLNYIYRPLYFYNFFIFNCTL